MAMARSSFKGMCCEVGTYLYTQGKTGASLMFQTWRRGLICLLVLASFPFLAPMIIVTMVVGGVFLVPLLCGVAACRALARPGSLLNIIKKIRFPKSVLRSGSAELVMEDLDVHDGGNRDHGASRGMFSPDCKDVADSSNVGIAAEGEDSASCVPSEKKLAVDEEIMKDKDVVLHGRNGRAQEEENRPSESLLSQELVEAKSPSQQYGEYCADDSDPEAGNQYLEIKETDAFHFDGHERERGEDQSMTVEPSDKDPVEDEFSILDITASGIQLELNLPADKEESSQVQVVDTQQEQLEEPEQLKENLPERAPEERLPDDSTAPYVLTEDDAPFVQGRGIAIPLVVSELVSDEKRVPEGEEEDVAAPSLESEVSMMEENSLPVESASVKLVSSIEDVFTIGEAAPVPEAVSASVEEYDAKDSEEPEVRMGEEKEKTDLMLECSASIMDQPALPVYSEPVELAFSVVDVSTIADAAPVQEAAALVQEFDAKEAAALVQEFDAKEAVVPDAPMMNENEVDASVEEPGISEPDTLVVEHHVVRQVVSRFAAPEVAAEEKAQFVQEKEVASELASDESEIPVVEEKDAPGASFESEISVMEKRSLPVVSEPVDLASSVAYVLDIDEPAFVEQAAPVEVYASAEEYLAEKVEDPETPVVEGKEIRAPVAGLEEMKVEEQSVVLAPAQEDAAPEPEAPIAEPESTEGVKAKPAACKAVKKFGDVELPPLNVEESTVADENLDQASKDGTIKVSNLELEDVPLTSASYSMAQLGERGNEADEDVQKLEEDLEKDKVVESHMQQDVFPTLKPLNVVQCKDSSFHEQEKECDSISTRAPVQRRIGFENVRADEKMKTGAPFLPIHSTHARISVQSTNFIFKSRLGRDHRNHRHSAPDFLATQTWVREAPLYSPQDSFRGHKKAKYKKWPELEGATPARTFSASVSDSGEPHMGEFESLLQSWWQRDKATHSPAALPSDSPRSPAEVGRLIREEISTIQKIIGQEIPPQYSLWKEVETLCQIVGMVPPFMGDVSDLTKARHGLDVLKVVLGIK